MTLEDMLNVSLDVKVEPENNKQYATIVRGDRTIISGMDGVGKSTFALSILLAEYQNNPNILCVYIDADDKSAKQVKQFAEFFRDKLQGQYLNLPLINKQLEPDKRYDMLDFLIEYTADWGNTDRQYLILIDNLTHLTGEFENDNSRVTAVRTELENSFLKLPNVKTMIIAHSGKADRGMRRSNKYESSIW